MLCAPFLLASKTVDVVRKVSEGGDILTEHY